MFNSLHIIHMMLAEVRFEQQYPCQYVLPFNFQDSTVLLLLKQKVESALLLLLKSIFFNTSINTSI